MTVMIMIIAVIGSPVAPMTITQEFSSQESCREAESALRKQIENSGIARPWGVFGGCFKR